MGASQGQHSRRCKPQCRGQDACVAASSRTDIELRRHGLWPEGHIRRIHPVLIWAQRHGIAPSSILLGEFGVTALYGSHRASDPMSQEAWMRMSALRPNGGVAGWALWALWDMAGSRCGWLERRRQRAESSIASRARHQHRLLTGGRSCPRARHETQSEAGRSSKWIGVFDESALLLLATTKNAQAPSVRRQSAPDNRTKNVRARDTRKINVPNRPN